LTRSRAATIKAIAKAVCDGAIRFDAGNTADELRDRLLAIPGIGPWTVEYIALRGLGDPDAFPAEDLILRRMAGNGAALTTAVLRKRSEAWRPWRAYVVMHLWRAA
jgi:AraC family transcriptional regulator of adaptative response / DNA-3-methyladenine glycosylase II